MEGHAGTVLVGTSDPIPLRAHVAHELLTLKPLHLASQRRDFARVEETVYGTPAMLTEPLCVVLMN
jgi:hypothetical protein